VQVGPYVARFTSPGPTSPSFSVVCIDYSNYAADGWMNVTSLAGGALSDMGATRLGGNFAAYQQAAYLGSLFDSWEDYQGVGYSATTPVGAPGAPSGGGVTVSGTFLTRANVFSGIHAAIWRVMTAGTSNAFPFLSTDPGVDPDGQENLAYAMGQYFVERANSFAGAFSTDGWYVLSPTEISGSTVEQRLRDGGQEFLIRTPPPPQVVPEPSTWILLGSGLALLLVFHRRRRPKIEA
jgi:hypothetical protein